LYAFNSLISLIKIAFHERESHNNFFPIFADYIHNLSKNFNFIEYIKVELAILQESGYGLELNECTVTGSKDDLHYVSPKTGRAVCKGSGVAYHNKLLILPKFLVSEVVTVTDIEKQQAFDLTTYFFNRYFSQNNTLSSAREAFIALVLA
jgi:DNA repair protein RecO (recombination protein O)